MGRQISVPLTMSYFTKEKMQHKKNNEYNLQGPTFIMQIIQEHYLNRKKEMRD